MSEAPERIRVWPDYDDHFSPARHDWTGGIWDDTDDASGIEYIRADLSQAAVEALEAKLAKAVETLKRYGGVMPVAFTPIQDGGYKARATLAELTGGKDE